MTPEEPNAEVAKELALRRTFVTVPLSVGPIRVERLEPFPSPRYLGIRIGTSGLPSRGAPDWFPDVQPPRRSNATPLLLTTPPPVEVVLMPYYECPKCGGGYVIDVPPSARPICDRDGARLKRASDASYEKNARRD